MTFTEVRGKGAHLHASDSYGEFNEEFIADVLEAEKECKMGLCVRFDNIDDLLASLDE